MASRRGGRRTTSWKIGQSGNPGGRPKGFAGMRDLARQKTEKAIETLEIIMNGKNTPPNARINAIKELLNRAWGHVPQAMELSASEKENQSSSWDLTKLTTAELNLLIRLGEKATMNGSESPNSISHGRAKQ